MLKRLRCAEGGFSSLERQWGEECGRYGESFTDYASPQIEHARRICGETPQDASYGIFALWEGDSIASIMHVNAARLPKVFGVTLRVLWIITSPEYDFGDVSHAKFAGLATGIVFGAKDLAANEFKADHLKIHLGGLGDREFFNGVASTLENLSLAGSARIAGNWLQIDRLTKPETAAF